MFRTIRAGLLALANHLMPAFKQFFSQVGADKAGDAGNEYFHVRTRRLLAAVWVKSGRWSVGSEPNLVDDQTVAFG